MVTMVEHSFNYLDIAVLFIIGLSTLIGFFRGFVASSMSMAGWVLSLCLTYMLFPKLAPYLEGKLSHPIAVVVVGYMGLIMTLLIAFGVLNMVFCSATASMRKGIIDRSLGAGLGIFRGLFIMATAFLSMTIVINLLQGHDDVTDESGINHNWVVNAQTYHTLVQSKNTLVGVLPESFNNGIQQFYDQYLNSKSSDERFIAYASDKLAAKLPEDVLNDLEKDRAEQSLIMSERDVEVYHLRRILQEYEQSDAYGKNPLPKTDLKRVKAIINGNVNAQHNAMQMLEGE